MPFPTVQGESIEVTLQFAMLLRDGVTNSNQLVGDVTVSSGSILGKQKDSTGAFLFLAPDLKPGPQSFVVKSKLDTPYYLAVQIPVTVPMPSPLWPAFPDVTLANRNLPLGDPGQTAAYKTQRQLATLLPTTAYPFPAGSTLIRGAVMHGGLPLAGALVQETPGSDPAYTTGPDGQFVIFLANPPGLPQAVTLTATYPALPAGTATVTVIRGLTVSATINM
ncbi:hypothetical protein RBB77_01660 [Tunturibacter psychrotolerans]|uniref:Carboxypeptidase regulatory-like domain-containing protein n=1 Tax=Tunturiibacter psychrotolerans TaxID=3069686 RepID=A0AAU7ZRS1_9BACT